MAPCHPMHSLFTRLRRIGRRARYIVKRLAKRKVLIHIENRWRLGDEIMAIPFYELVRERYPGAAITVSVSYPELIRGLPGIEINNTPSEFDCDLFIHARPGERAVPRLESLCRRHRIPYRELQPHLPPAVVGLASPGRYRRCVAFSTGAGWPCKSWSTRRFRELATHISAARPGVRFVEVGRACPSAGVGEDLIDRLGIADVARVLSECALYVGPDSGLVHLAMAVNTPAVGLFGPVIPTLAFGHRPLLCAVESPATCRGCWTEGRMREPGVCPLGISDHDPDAYPCMRHLTSDWVYARMETSGLLENLS